MRHDRRHYRAITLRDGDTARFAVEVGECIMVTSDLGGTRLLARLLWGLSFQRHPDTVLLIGSSHLVPNPSDGRPSPPMVFLSNRLSSIDASAARHLHRQLPFRRPSEGTVTWNTQSYPRALAELLTWQKNRWSGVPDPERYWPEPHTEPKIAVLGGVVVITAEPDTLRDWALEIGSLGRFWYYGESCAEPDATGAFDVHAVRHFHRQVSIARRARDEVLSMTGAPTDPLILRDLIAGRLDIVAARRPGPWDP